MQCSYIKCMRNNDPMAMLAYSEARQGVEEIQDLNLSVLPELNGQSSEEDFARYRHIMLENIKTLQRQLVASFHVFEMSVVLKLYEITTACDYEIK